MMAHKRQIEALKTSLKAADQRISEAELINVNLETEVFSIFNNNLDYQSIILKWTPSLSLCLNCNILNPRNLSLTGYEAK